MTTPSEKLAERRSEIHRLLDCRRCTNGQIITTTGDGSHGTLEQEPCPHCDGSALADVTVQAAMEVLATRELVPLHWTDPALAPLWWCPGRGNHGEPGALASCPCNRGTWPLPLSGAELIAVAALGRDALVNLELLVAEQLRPRTGHKAGPTRIIWCSMPRYTARTRCWPVVPHGNYANSDPIRALPPEVHLLGLEEQGVLLVIEDPFDPEQRIPHPYDPSRTVLDHYLAARERPPGIDRKDARPALGPEALAALEANLRGEVSVPLFRDGTPQTVRRHHFVEAQFRNHGAEVHINDGTGSGYVLRGDGWSMGEGYLGRTVLDYAIWIQTAWLGRTLRLTESEAIRRARAGSAV